MKSTPRSSACGYMGEGSKGETLSGKDGRSGCCSELVRTEKREEVEIAND